MKDKHDIRVIKLPTCHGRINCKWSGAPGSACPSCWCSSLGAAVRRSAGASHHRCSASRRSFLQPLGKLGGRERPPGQVVGRLGISTTTPCSALLRAPRPAERGVPRPGGKDAICGPYHTRPGGMGAMENQEVSWRSPHQQRTQNCGGWSSGTNSALTPLTCREMVKCKSQGKHNPPPNPTPQIPKPQCKAPSKHGGRHQEVRPDPALTAPLQPRGTLPGSIPPQPEPETGSVLEGSLPARTEAARSLAEPARLCR